MIKLSRLADYAVTLLAQMARAPEPTVLTAKSLSKTTGLPFPTVTKLLKKLARAGLLTSIRGATGGYSLEKSSQTISVADVITAIDGPPALTKCIDPNQEPCSRETTCLAKPSWELVNAKFLDTLNALTIAEIATNKPVSQQRSTPTMRVIPEDARRRDEPSSNSSRHVPIESIGVAG